MCFYPRNITSPGLKLSLPVSRPMTLLPHTAVWHHTSSTDLAGIWWPAQLAASIWNGMKAQFHSTPHPIGKKKSTISLPIFKNQRKLRTSSNSFIFFSFLIWQLANSCRNYFRGKGRCIWCVSATNRLWCISQHIINSDRTKGEWF